ncbi:MAG: sigma-70 family RNA polymerase sigma factor [Candidatus Dormibacterales bacterium]
MAPRSGDRGPGGAPQARRGASSTDLPPAGRGRVRARTEGERAPALLEQGLPLVARLAGARTGRGLAEEDLRQEGVFGLMAAVREFSLAGGGREAFEAVAERRIGEAMDAALMEEGEAVERGRLLVEDAARYERAEFSLAGELGRAPSCAEVAARLGWPLRRVETVGDLVAGAREAHDEGLIAYLDDAGEAGG